MKKGGALCSVVTFGTAPGLDVRANGSARTPRLFLIWWAAPVGRFVFRFREFST